MIIGKRKLLLKMVTFFILHSTDLEMTDISSAITARYKKVSPDWEVTLVSFPTDPVRREKMLYWMIEFFRNHPGP